MFTSSPTAAFVSFARGDASWRLSLQGREKKKPKYNHGEAAKSLQPAPPHTSDVQKHISGWYFHLPDGGYDILYFSYNSPAGTCIVSAQQRAAISSRFVAPYTSDYHLNIRGLSQALVRYNVKLPALSAKTTLQRRKYEPIVPLITNAPTV